jgi:hypothetical protein
MKQDNGSSTNWSILSSGTPSVQALTKTITQASHGLSVGNPVFFSTTYQKAKADADSTSEVLGIVTSVPDANTFVLSGPGYVTGLSGLTANTMMFLSTATAGAVQATEPTLTGHVSKPIIFADSTTSGYFVIMRGAVIGGGGGVRSMVRVHTGNGWGSTNTAIRRFSTVVTNTGSAITYADSATLGATFTINETGVYAITNSDSLDGTRLFGISLNSTQLATDFQNITTADRLIMAHTFGFAIVLSASWTGILNAGDVVRHHTQIVAAGGSQDRITFTITKVSN